MYPKGMSEFQNVQSLSTGLVVRVFDTWDARRENWMLGAEHTIDAIVPAFVAGERVTILSFTDGTHTHVENDEEVFVEN